MVIATKEIEVRYAETDQMGVVYHANYFVWMELGRTSFIEKLGYNYAEMEKDGIISPVMDIQASYKKPIRYGEKATVKTWVEEYDGIRVTYGYEILTESGEIAVIGLSRHVCVKKESFRPISLKRLYPEWHAAYEKAKKKQAEIKR
ncbi:thioesterase family protein [Neobacillus sp. PS3-34]|uniref:acyl-CoA thioesterase n=1 Tax=Neobacillus sp. PS3-34 TaxID=3070678 RepID=UPI0027E1798D|nr:thioesterase family protein [Neobacillus sp. PS3-34]WML48193.1 thioesterase family protein [Neobacillus sp. PS3-34]